MWRLVPLCTLLGSPLGCDLVRTGPTEPATLPPFTGTALEALPVAEGRLRLLLVDGLPPSPPPVEALEAQTGCAVEITSVRSAYTQWSTAREEPFDVVLSPSHFVRRLVRDDALQPLNLALLPSVAELPERFREAAWAQLDGTPFSVPVALGPQGLIVATPPFEALPDSWGVLFDPTELPDGTTTVGRVQAYEQPITFAEVALWVRGVQPDLGIVDPYALRKPQIFAAIRAVRGQRAVVGKYWNDPEQQVADFLGGRAVVASGWRYTYHQLRQAGAEVAWVIPKEGATAWALAGVVPRNAAHPGCAYRFLDHLLTPEVQASLALAYKALPARLDVCESEALPPEHCAAEGRADLHRLHVWQTPERLGPHCGHGDEACYPLHKWIGRYTLTRGGL